MAILSHIVNTKYNKVRNDMIGVKPLNQNEIGLTLYCILFISTKTKFILLCCFSHFSKVTIQLRLEI